MIRFEDLVEKVGAYTSPADVELLRRAYVFSAFEHKGQIRHSGEPYLVHPLEVANILADMKLDVVAVGELTMLLIKRGERYGIRVRNRNSRERREFIGLRWFPVRESYRIEADFVAYDRPKGISIANVLGDVNEMLSPGYATFSLAGRKWRLQPVLDRVQHVRGHEQGHRVPAPRAAEPPGAGALHL